MSSAVSSLVSEAVWSRPGLWVPLSGHKSPSPSGTAHLESSGGKSRHVSGRLRSLVYLEDSRPTSKAHPNNGKKSSNSSKRPGQGLKLKHSGGMSAPGCVRPERGHNMAAFQALVITLRFDFLCFLLCFILFFERQSLSVVLAVLAPQVRLF